MTIWYTARGAGLSALVLLSAATMLGALTSRRGGSGNRVVTQYLHRVLAGLGIGVLALHIAMILADSFAHVGIVGALVPFSSSYRPLWVGLGSLAAYSFILISALGFARGRMAGSRRGAAVWRSIHCFAYAGWGLAILHGFKSGTDSEVGWVRLLYVVCLLGVLGTVAARLSSVARREVVLAAMSRSRTPISATTSRTASR